MFSFCFAPMCVFWRMCLKFDVSGEIGLERALSSKKNVAKIKAQNDVIRNQNELHKYLKVH
jgi:hypothetical protein